MKAHVLNAFFSLVFAILILSAAATHLTTDASYSVPITITAPDQVEIGYGGQSGNRLTLKNAVTVVVRGPRELLERHRQQGTIKGDYAIPQEDVDEKSPLPTIEILKRRIPEGLSLESVSPATLELTYSRRGSQRVYVSPGQILGKPAAGYRIGTVTCVKNVVTAEGDETLLEKYPGSQDNPHYKTQPFDLATRGVAPRSTITVQLPVAPPDPGIQINETVEVRIEIVPELVEEEIEFPIKFVRNPSSDGIAPLPYRVTAKGGWSRRIKLRGPSATLAAIRDAVRSKIVTNQVPFAYVQDTLTASEPGAFDSLYIKFRGLPDGVEILSSGDDLMLSITAERP